MDKIDYKKKLSDFYQAKIDKPIVVQVPKMNFIMIDGKGDPNKSKEYQDAMQVLFTLSYTLKFMIKKGKEEIDYHVLPLEGLWWADDMNSFTSGDKDKWFWTMMIRQPDFITAEHFKTALENAKKKKPELDFSKVRFEKLTEGNSVQIMHIGPFTAEGPTIQKVHDKIASLGMKRSGKHHEIYLSDIRKAEPGKWKTVIRQPIA